MNQKRNYSRRCDFGCCDGALPLILLVVVCLGLTQSTYAQANEKLNDKESLFTAISIEPDSVHLNGPDSLRGLLVHGTREDGRIVDLTRRARYLTTAPDRFTVDQKGVVKGLDNGSGDIQIVFKNHTVLVPVYVENIHVPRNYHFENDIIPILSKYNCNSSGCHGKAEGQNGFKLSVFGFDPQADYHALVKQGRGRRTFPAAAKHSLLLAKAAGLTPHGGGVRIAKDSHEFNVLQAWIAAGVPFGDSNAPKIATIEILPAERIMDINEIQQLRVLAHYDDGDTIDITSIAKYHSNNKGLASVDEHGIVRTADAPGQVAVMATYSGVVNTFRTLIPRKQKVQNYPVVVEHNFIDQLVHARLKKLNIVPSALAGDAEFVRRSYIGIIGTLPTVEEARRFLDSSDPAKRSHLIDELLKRPEYDDYWALKWADLLRVDRQALGHKRAYAYYEWIRQSFAENKSLDQFVRDILTFAGNTTDAPQVSFYRVVGDPNKIASTVSQVFLGVRIECAQCHHHPFDRWSQTDYYGMTAFFRQVNRKGTIRGEMMVPDGNPKASHPRTGATIYAHALGETMPDKLLSGDQRQMLADWMTGTDNPWFARNAANRLWAHLMGRGLVEPVDDFRDTNPPSNPELLDALASYLVENGYDVKELIRAITASATYQRTSRPNETNEEDEQNYSRALLKRLDAEVLLDAVCQVTGLNEKFRGVPFGARAIELWDSEVDHYFLKLFGRPTRKTACQCERSTQPTVGQVLHLLNSPEIHIKLSHEAGRIAQLADNHPGDRELIESIYLTFLSRRPISGEQAIAIDYFNKNDNGRRVAAEDLAWSLMNSLEFMFNH